MASWIRVLPLAVMTMAAAGCATIEYDAVTIENLVALNRVVPEGRFERVGDLDVETRAIFLIAELVTMRDAELERLLRREMVRYGGDAVMNLRITEEYDVIDFLVGAVQGALIGGGLVNTRRIQLRGDIVRMRGTGGERDDGLGRLAGACEPLEIPATADAPARIAYVCLAPQPLRAGS